MKTKEFKGITSQNAAKANSLILNAIEYSCIPFNSWFETHSRLRRAGSDEDSCLFSFRGISGISRISRETGLIGKNPD